MTAKGSNVVSGIKCLGNTIKGLNQENLRHLFKTCVIPVLTYGCQLWYDPDHPKKSFLRKLQVVQNNALRHIAGAFRTTPIDTMHLLSFQPPIEVTIRKLCESAAIRFFRLPPSSEITLRLPKTYVPP